MIRAAFVIIAITCTLSTTASVSQMIDTGPSVSITCDDSNDDEDHS